MQKPSGNTMHIEELVRVRLTKAKFSITHAIKMRARQPSKPYVDYDIHMYNVIIIIGTFVNANMHTNGDVPGKLVSRCLTPCTIVSTYTHALTHRHSIYQNILRCVAVNKSNSFPSHV